MDEVTYKAMQLQKELTILQNKTIQFLEDRVKELTDENKELISLLLSKKIKGDDTE